VRRLVTRFILGAWLCMAGGLVAYAQPAPDDATDADTVAPEQPPPVGPILQASNNAPVICDPSTPGFRYVEVRGTGFDAWATQRLVGNVVDGNGRSQMQWGSVWVSPQGNLTLEVNLCADPFRNRPALAAGDYTVIVGPGSGQPLAATSIALSPPADPQSAGDQPESMPAAAPANASPTPVPTAIPYVLPNIAPAPTPTPLPPVSIPGGTTSSRLAAPTPGPRTGPGSLQQPIPLGAPGTLADGWQLVVTGVTPDAWTGIHAEVPSTIAPASDQRDYMVRVQATFLGQGTGVFSGMRLALVSGIQTTYDQLHNSCGTVPDMVPPNLMTSGGSVRGNVCFTVRTSDIDTLTMFDNQSTENDRVYFALK
jgi:hypothetical protein